MPMVRGKALGRKKPLFADWSIPVPPRTDDGDEGLTLRQVIAAVVREQVAAFRQRQADNQGLRFLTSHEIAEAADRGRITMGHSEVGVQEVDTDAAIAAALLAFEDGLYLVAIDDVEQRSLDAQVFLQEDSRIVFVRLTLLAGG